MSLDLITQADPNTAREIIITCYNLQKKGGNYPQFLHGATGIGKSTIVKEASIIIAEKEGREFIEFRDLSPADKDRLADDEEYGSKYFVFADLRASEVGDPSEVKGMLNLENKKVVDMIPTRLSRVMAAKNVKGILFLDEFNLAPPSIQAAFYQVINDRSVGDLKFNDHFLFIAAGNRDEDRGFTYNMARPLCNRMGHMEIVNNINTWEEWALTKGLDMRVIAYHKRWEGDKLYLSPEKDPENKRISFPTWRMWSKMAQAIEGIETKDIVPKKSVIQNVLINHLGSEATAEFIQFLKQELAIDIEAFIKKPEEEYRKIENDLSQKFAVISILTSRYKNGKLTTEQALKCSLVFQRELRIDMVRMCSRASDRFKKDITNPKDKAFNLYNEFFQKDGKFFIEVSYPGN